MKIIAQNLKIRATVCKTIKLGTGLNTADAFRKALKKADCNIGDWGNDILGKPAFKVADKETEVELVVVSNVELGFEDGATVSETYARAKELGLELCPNEVGPQLRLQYKDQPKGEWLLIAMEPITGSDGDLGVFRVGRDGDGEQWLIGDRGRPDYGWDAEARWVFLRRKYRSKHSDTKLSLSLDLSPDEVKTLKSILNKLT